MFGELWMSRFVSRELWVSRFVSRFVPFKGFQCFKNGAGTRSRTKDFHITNVALYQLSYTGSLLISA